MKYFFAAQTNLSKFVSQFFGLKTFTANSKFYNANTHQAKLAKRCEKEALFFK
jgi:hypothetical protein